MTKFPFRALVLGTLFVAGLAATPVLAQDAAFTAGDDGIAAQQTTAPAPYPSAAFDPARVNELEAQALEKAEMEALERELAAYNKDKAAGKYDDQDE